jgi:tetratricopeptide (TPR) repeat protein
MTVPFQADISRNSPSPMLNKFYLFSCLILLTLLTPVVQAQNTAALTAEQYFSDANRLFRDRLYWAALLRYRQAMDGGINTPLLHYNMGVAHYRANQHIRARASLLKALDEPTLRLVTQYNLGLNAYAADDTDEALRWFRLSRDQDQNLALQKYSRIAISRIGDEEAKADDFEIRIQERKEKRNFTDLTLRAFVGFGTDDNVFRSPDQPYIDLSDPLRPVIVPEVQSGAFIPVSLTAKYLINSLPYEGFFVSYRFRGHYYLDKELENGNEHLHEAGFGNEYFRKEGERERSVYSAFKVAQHSETYYDPDDGGSRNVGGVDIDDRMNYVRLGPELVLRQSHEKLAIGAKVKGQLWNYEAQETVSEYDHEFFLLSVYGQYKFTETSLFRISLDGYTRRFSDRPSFDLDGRQLPGNPNIRYDYYSVELMARQRIMDSMWFGFNVARTDRSDKYVGYYDYTRDRVGFEFHWAPSNRFDFELNGAYSIYDYPNAFAFHEPLAGSRTQEVAEVGLFGSYRMTRHLTLIGKLRHHETASNDTRIQYERNQYSLGVRWEQ